MPGHRPDTGARQPLPPKLARQLRWPLRLTRAAITGERAWRAFWPLATLGMASIALDRFWGFGTFGAAVFAATLFAAFVWGTRRFRFPTSQEAEARLDQTLPHAPLAALRDSPAVSGTEASQSVWRAHLERMQGIAAKARAPAPDLNLAHHDPFALRLMAAVACVMALMFTTGHAPRPSTATPCTDCPTTASWEGWVEPPAYTGQPSLYLNDQPTGLLAVPSGSRLTLRLYGAEQGGIRLGGDLINGPLAEELQVEITRNAELSIAVAGTGQASAWRFMAVGDVPPKIRPDGELTRDLSGAFQQAFFAVDDYAVSSGAVQIALAMEQVARRHGLRLDPDPRPALVLDLPRPYRGDLREIQEVWQENLAEHPWAGLPVTVTLSARDDIGQQAEASPLYFPLPARRFFTRESRALIEMRRDLLWARAGAPRVAQILRAITHRPEDMSLPEGTPAALRALILDLEAAIDAGLNTEKQDALAATLWEIAVAIEEDGLDSARARMERAQERLAQAMREGATPEELAELMEELRRATQDYLDRLAQMPPESPPPGQDGEMMEMDADDLQAMMDRIEELMREGRMAEAMELLDQLSRMMENLQAAPGDGARANQQARQGLTDTLRQQQGLSDEAFRELQEQGGQGAQAGQSEGNTGRDGGEGRGQSHSGEGNAPGGEQRGNQGGGQQRGQELAQRQRDLQQQLQDQRQSLPGVGSEAGNAARDALGQAGRAMDRAAEALQDGDIPLALDHQADAMEAMREGLRQFDEATRNQQAQAGEQGQSGAQGNANGRDPLGREAGRHSGRGLADGDYNREAEMRRRAQELTDELRKRSGDTSLPQEERDYVERLLEQF